MRFADYSYLFHDGGLIEIRERDTLIEFVVHTMEVSNEENTANLQLVNLGNTCGNLNVLQGVIRLSGIREIKVEHEIVPEVGQFDYDDGEILQLEIEPNFFKLLVEWDNYPPKPRLERQECSLIEIKADKIEWIDELNDIHIELPD